MAVSNCEGGEVRRLWSWVTGTGCVGIKTVMSPGGRKASRMRIKENRIKETETDVGGSEVEIGKDRIIKLDQDSQAENVNHESTARKELGEIKYTKNSRIRH